MQRIIEYFIKRPKVVNLILAFIVITGAASFFQIKKQGYPAVDFGFVSISTTYPGASPKDVELKVTQKIEKELKGIDGVKKITSSSMENFSNITLQVEESALIDEVRNDVKEAVDKVSDLPEDAKKPIIDVDDMDSYPMFEIAITGKADYATKRKYALALEKKLRKNKYVGLINKVGYLAHEVKIEVDKKKMIKKHVPLGDIINAIKSQNFRMSAGDLKGDNEKKFVIMSEFEKLSDVGEVIIRSRFDGERIVVSDLAEVYEGYEKPEHIVRYNGKDAINLVVIKKPDADIVTAVASVKEIFEKFQEKLPPDISAEIIVDNSVETMSLLTLVVDNAWIGLLLVVVALILMLNIRIAFWTALGIPTSIFIAFTLFPVLGVTINFISLMAIIIVLGMLVDDAIVIAENIYRYREMGVPPDEAAMKGVKEVMWPVITTVLTTIVVFLPMIAMKGTMGKFMRVMPIVITVMLLASLAEGLFILPVHIAHTKIKKKKSRRENFFRAFEKFYKKVLIKTMQYKLVTILVFLIIFGVAIGLLFLKGQFQLFASDDGLYGSVVYELEQGIKLDISAEKAREIEEILLSMPEDEVTGFITTVGQKNPEALSYGTNFNSSFYGNIMIYFTPIEDRKRTAKQIMDEVKEKLEVLEGFKKLEAEMAANGPPVGRPVTVTLVSNDDVERNRLVEDMKDFLKEQPGVSRVEDNQGVGKKQIELSFDYKLMSRLGLNPFDVSNTIRTAFDGMVVTSLKWDGEDVDFRVILNEDSRKELDTLTSLTMKHYKSLTVQNAYGQLIPLGRFINMKEKDDLMMIHHYDFDRSTTIYADIDTDKNTSLQVNGLIRKKYKPIVDALPEMELVFGGEEQDTQEAMESLKIAMIIAIVGIYFILMILFNSYFQPLLVMITIPFSFAAVAYAFLIHNMPLSFPAMIGMIGLSGVVVNDSLVMITFLNNQRQKGKKSLDELAEAAKHRLRPIFLTTATTAAGLFPTAYGFGGQNPMIIPMIMAIAWGLIFATVLTLFLLPSLYLLQVEIGDFFGRIFGKKNKKHDSDGESGLPSEENTVEENSAEEISYEEHTEEEAGD